MSQNKAGCQTIGCNVKSCRFNDKGTYCALARIQVEPCLHSQNSGNPEDESLCGSYRPR